MVAAERAEGDDHHRPADRIGDHVDLVELDVDEDLSKLT